MSVALREAEATQPFEFVDYEILVMPTGRRAGDLREFLTEIRGAPAEVLRHHLHGSSLRHRFRVWDHPNDFAEWAAQALGDYALAEKLAALDPFGESEIDRAREAIVELVEDHLDELPFAPAARPGREFHFASSIAVAIPSGRKVTTLAGLRQAVADVSLATLYYHFHAARLRGPGDDADDFSRWLDGQFGDTEIAARLSRLDFYLLALDELRARVLAIFDEALATAGGEAP